MLADANGRYRRRVRARAVLRAVLALSRARVLVVPRAASPHRAAAGRSAPRAVRYRRSPSSKSTTTEGIVSPSIRRIVAVDDGRLLVVLPVLRPGDEDALADEEPVLFHAPNSRAGAGAAAIRCARGGRVEEGASGGEGRPVRPRRRDRGRQGDRPPRGRRRGEARAAAASPAAAAARRATGGVARDDGVRLLRRRARRARPDRPALPGLHPVRGARARAARRGCDLLRSRRSC